MQLFVVNDCPTVCARYLDDARLNKIILETGQMLSTAIRMHIELDDNLDRLLYKTYNPGHPVTKWVATNLPNFLWTIEYHTALILEKYRRTGKWHAAASRFNLGQVFRSFAHDVPLALYRTPFANAARRQDLNIDMTMIKPTTLAYRLYLEARWELDALNQRPATCRIPETLQ